MAAGEQGRQRDDEAGRAALRALPSVSKLLADPEIVALAGGMPPAYLSQLIASELEAARALLLAGEAPELSPRERLLARLRLLLMPKLRPVINATGVVLHTNLGRAPVSAAAAAMAEALRHYTPLELDLASGGRGGRMAEIEALLAVLTGAEAALVVNNNAAATALTLGALAAGRAVILSRGEAVEIGGGFRVPDVMRQSGAALVEVGTTNRTYARDYETAIAPETAALLKVHTSNFRITGFTHEATIADLAELGRRHNLPVIHDLGSGALRETSAFGLAHEPTVGESLRDGAAVALFSGDKLLGGPQAGIIAGRRDLVATIARHPLARAVRADKATLAGVAATLRHYLLGEETTAIPIWRMIAVREPDLRARAEALQATLAADGIVADVVSTRSTVGGGSLPEETLPTAALAFTSTGLAARGLTLDTFAARLRAGAPPIVARIVEERCLLDSRTIFPDDDPALLAGLRAALAP
ncbi:MAG: L-seryl-tRNA(Sec) selenium transferase [Thermomicrobiales bacterium]